MFDQIISLIPAMWLGCLAVLVLILCKGDICPGQRGRIYKTFPILGIFALLAAWHSLSMIVSAVSIGYFFSRVKTGKTRQQGPKWALNVAVVAALITVALDVVSLPNVTSAVGYLLCVPLLGAALVHVFLLIARSRLQAFHRVLPFTGTVCALGLVSLLMACVYVWPQILLSSHAEQAVISFLLLIASVGVWCGHIFVNKAPQKWQLQLSLLMLIASIGSTFSLLQL
ncbi:hypothetical protein L4C34_04625 [Vibrio profundum]|uniref:hypothetical protein n=1 Tax=Vibrio profundum TaxID=2910247 RepID=UPI003D130F86